MHTRRSHITEYALVLRSESNRLNIVCVVAAAITSEEAYHLKRRRCRRRGRREPSRCGPNSTTRRRLRSDTKTLDRSASARTPPSSCCLLRTPE